MRYFLFTMKLNKLITIILIILHLAQPQNCHALAVRSAANSIKLSSPEIENLEYDLREIEAVLRFFEIGLGNDLLGSSWHATSSLALSNILKYHALMSKEAQREHGIVN